jgi:hypothetical protein
LGRGLTHAIEMPLLDHTFDAAVSPATGFGSKLDDSLVTESHIPPHPLGVRPLGNQYLISGPTARTATGTFRSLPDEILMSVLEYLAKDSLQNLGYSCKFLFALCFAEELWRSLFLE